MQAATNGGRRRKVSPVDHPMFAEQNTLRTPECNLRPWIISSVASSPQQPALLLGTIFTETISSHKISIMSALLTLLPADDGWLPKWMLLVSTVAALNSVQNLLTVNVTKKIYSKRPMEGTNHSLERGIHLSFKSV